MFIKFKKYMKNVKSNMISDLQGYKNIVNMLELWPLDFQKYVEMLKDTKSDEVIDMLNEVLGDLTKYDIKSAKEGLKEHIEILSTHIYTCDSQIRAFDNEKAGTVLESSVSMIQKLNLKIVAEGVETKEQMEALTAMGCEYLQGYYFSKPLPEKEFLEYLDSAHKRNIP